MTDYKRVMLDSDGNIWGEYNNRWWMAGRDQGESHAGMESIGRTLTECAVVPLDELEKPEGGERPSYIPEYLYLITADGEWPITATEDESAAIRAAERRQSNSPDRHVRITKVHIGACEPLEIQHEVINRKLVPEGTAVQS